MTRMLIAYFFIMVFVFPGESVQLPLVIHEAAVGETLLTVRAYTMAAHVWCKPMFQLGASQFAIANHPAPAIAAPARPELTVEETEQEIRIHSLNGELTFSKVSGTVSEWKASGRDVMASGPQVGFGIRSSTTTPRSTTPCGRTTSSM